MIVTPPWLLIPFADASPLPLQDGGRVGPPGAFPHVAVADPVPLWELGVHGVSLHQYLRWADDVDLFVGMANEEPLTCAELVGRTPLTARGVEAMLGVLSSLGLVRRIGGAYALDPVAREYLDRRGSYYLGGILYGMLNAPLPPQLKKGEPIRRYSRFTGTLRDRIRYWRKSNQMGRPEQLRVQHSRNLPAAVFAVRAGHFAGVRHLADIGGGSGTFAIPLALDRPDMRITIIELPRALRHITPFLERHGVQDRIRLVGFNVHRTPWPLADCDAVLFGNVMHFCDDDECLAMLQESYRVLPPGGRLFIHEMLWNEEMNGPLVTALWNFWMATFSAGRQRSACQFAALLTQAGFVAGSAVPTLGGFSLMTATKSRG
jgi:acetylserotonin N-methyltransferase